MTIDELEKEIQNLSHADFNDLARRLGLNAPPRQQWANVEINDDDKKPIAILEYSDGTKHRIDIFTWIRKNIMAIGNPIMLIAIYHWYEILRHRAALTFKDAYDDQEGWQGETGRTIRKWFYSGRPEKASNNLLEIGKIISDAADDRRLSRDEAFVAQVQHRRYNEKNTLLYEAFEWLRKDKTRNDGQRLSKLEDALRKTRVSNHSIPVERVIGFLGSEKGKRHIRPKRWDAILNAYLAWHYNLEPYTVRRYFSNARRRKNENDNEIDTRFLFPKGNQYELLIVGGGFARRALFVPDTAYLKDDEEEFGHPVSG